MFIKRPLWYHHTTPKIKINLRLWIKDYLNKNAPLGGGTSQDDDSYPRWEQTLANWLSWH